MRSPTPRMTPIAAGLCVSAASRLPRVCGRVVERDALARASSSERSRSSSLSARAPSRWASARGRLVARVAALVERDDARRRPRARAAPATPGEHARAAAAASARLAARLVVEEGALARVELGVVRRPTSRAPRPAARRGRARRGRARARPTRAPRRQVPVQRAGPRRPPRASRAAAATRAAAPRARPRPRPSLTVTQPAVGERRTPRPRRALELGERHAAAHDAPPSPSPASRSRIAGARRRCRSGVELAVGALGQPRDRAAHAAGALVGGEAQRAGRRARCHSSSSAVDSSGSAPGSSGDVGDQRVDELRLDAQAGAPRRQLDRAPQLVAAHRADEHVVGAEQPRTAPGSAAQRP